MSDGKHGSITHRWDATYDCHFSSVFLGYPVPDVGPGSDDGYPVPVADPGPFTKLGPTVAATASAVVLRATAQFPPLPLPRQPLSRSPSLYFTTVAAVHIAAFIGLWLILPLQSAFNSWTPLLSYLRSSSPSLLSSHGVLASKISVKISFSGYCFHVVMLFRTVYLFQLNTAISTMSVTNIRI